MRIRLLKEYRGKLTGGSLLRPGVHDLGTGLIHHLLVVHSEICETIPQDTPLTDTNEEIMEDREEKNLVINVDEIISALPPDSDTEVGKSDYSISRFMCCGKDWKNQGRLNFHRRNRKCPFHKG